MTGTTLKMGDPRSITGELQEATSKYGREYGWQHRVLRTDFRGTTPERSTPSLELLRISVIVITQIGRS